ncbi:hypothetical protein C8F04DRAFT_1397932 [Mycena alexandri]|uniref:C3H1-type domain-containing protein n=1 Tax=Mycena alexandri TaxID=1745969 RepID=A0AAD6SPP1_9AGAR|nr:hypothetical protein C8F04DRAFT_1397932 [Mycena alexandri]
MPGGRPASVGGVIVAAAIVVSVSQTDGATCRVPRGQFGVGAGSGHSLVPAYILALRRVVVTDTVCLLLVWVFVSGCSLSMGLFLRWGSIRGIGTVGITAELDVHPGWIQQYLRTAVSLVAVSRPLMQMDLSLTLAFADAMETYLAGGSVSVVRSEEQRWEPTRALWMKRYDSLLGNRGPTRGYEYLRRRVYFDDGCMSSPLRRPRPRNAASCYCGAALDADAADAPVCKDFSSSAPRGPSSYYFTTVLELAPDNAAAQAALRDLRAEQAAAASSSAKPAEPAAPAADASAPPPADSTSAAAPVSDAPPPDPEAEAAIDAALAHPRPSSPAPSLPDSHSDTSDARHRPSATPCLFYNTSHCARGSACAFSHAPDRRSVRDGLGKNVCLYWLVGLCKFGGKCIYKHGREALGEGWWGTEEGVKGMRERVEREREGRKKGREAREKRSGGKGGKGGKGKGRATDGAEGAEEGAAAGARQPNGRNAKNAGGKGGAKPKRNNNNTNNNKNATLNPHAQAQAHAAALAYAQQQQEALTIELTRRMALYDLSVAAVARGAVLSPRTPSGFTFPLPMSPRFDAGFGAGAGVGDGAASVGAGGETQGGFTEYAPPPRVTEGVQAPAAQGDAEASGGLTY